MRHIGVGKPLLDARPREQKAVWGKGTATMLPDRPTQRRTLGFVSDALIDQG
jgi:hypothetical protein